MIKTNSMGTVKLTAVISGWDITEFLMPMAQKEENKTKKPTLCFYMGRESEEIFKAGEVVKPMTGGADKSYWKITDDLLSTIYISEVISF